MLVQILCIKLHSPLKCLSFLTCIATKAQKRTATTAISISMDTSIELVHHKWGEKGRALMKPNATEKWRKSSLRNQSKPQGTDKLYDIWWSAFYLSVKLVTSARLTMNTSTDIAWTISCSILRCALIGIGITAQSNDRCVNQKGAARFRLVVLATSADASMPYNTLKVSKLLKTEHLRRKVKCNDSTINIDDKKWCYLAVCHFQLDLWTKLFCHSPR